MPQPGTQVRHGIIRAALEPLAIALRAFRTRFAGSIAGVPRHFPFGFQLAFALSASALTRSACSVASSSACCDRSVSRDFVSAFSASRAFMIALRSAARAVRSVSRSASAGSAALARNFSSAAFLAMAAASCRLRKSGSLKPLIYSDLVSNAEDPPVDVCTQFRQRTRQPTTVASMKSPVSTFCQAPPLHRHRNGMT